MADAVGPHLRAAAPEAVSESKGESKGGAATATRDAQNAAVAAALDLGLDDDEYDQYIVGLMRHWDIDEVDVDVVNDGLGAPVEATR